MMAKALQLESNTSNTYIMSVSEKVVFVTGGSGFVGRNLIPLLVSEGYKVKALARSERSSDIVRALGAETVMGDLNDERAITKGVAGCTSVFHLAASVDFYASETELMQTHVEATKLLISKAREVKVRRFVYLGAASVIIDGKPIIRADETFVSDNLKDGYSITKLRAEELVLRTNTESFSTISLRPPLVWGKGDLHTLPSIVEAINSGQFMFVNGGKHLFNTCHVSNVCHALLLAEQTVSAEGAYFVTDDEDLVFKDFITKYVAGEVRSVPQRSIPLFLARWSATFMETVWAVLRLKGAPPIYNGLINVLGLEFTVDIDKAKIDLGYLPIKTVSQGLDDMIS